MFIVRCKWCSLPLKLTIKYFSYGYSSSLSLWIPPQKTDLLLLETGRSGRPEFRSSCLWLNRLWSRRASRPSVGFPHAHPDRARRRLLIASVRCGHRGDVSLSFWVYIPEQTAGEVLQMGGLHEEAPRKVWGMNPDSQVLRVLQEAELQPLTLPMENATICEEDSSVPGWSSC